MLLPETKQTEREAIALLIRRLGYISALLQAEQHPKNLGDSAVQASRDLAYRETARRSGEKLQNIQTFFERRSGIVALSCGFNFGHEESR